MSLFGGRRGARDVAAGLIPVLPRFVGLLGRLLVDGRVSLMKKGLVMGVAAYVLMPVDLIPDILGVFGWTDDLFLVGLALRQLVLGAGAEVVRDNWRGSDESLDRLQGSLEDLGSLLPGPVQGLLERWAGGGSKSA